MLKIRLMRIGAKKKPFYRVVAVDERNKRTGGYIELLGTYNPLTEPKEIRLKQDRIDHWVKQGAQLSTGFLRIIGKAPQRLPRKAKKEKKTEEPSAISNQPLEKTEESVTKPNEEEATKSESVEAIGEVEHTNESNDSSQEEGAKQATSEPTGEASGASRPDELTEENKNEGSA